jgi:SAM-dependent methyltransferase
MSAAALEEFVPSVAENKATWSDPSRWTTSGHEWSRPWGSAADQWFATIHRRIFNLLPTDVILDIGPGFGRWTPFLIDSSSHYLGVDIAEPCLAHCRETYGAHPKKPEFLLGNGVSFGGIGADCVSLVFSFDTLVFAELDCIAAYAREIRARLPAPLQSWPVCDRGPEPGPARADRIGGVRRRGVYPGRAGRADAGEDEMDVQGTVLRLLFPGLQAQGPGSGAHP